MARASLLFQDHHVLEQRTFRNNDLLEALVEAGLVERDAFANRINMPSDRILAQALGISPHNGGPIRDYNQGTELRLNALATSRDGIAALEGDPRAQERMAAKVHHLRDTMKLGLVNGDLFTNAPLGLRPDDIRPTTQAFFHGQGAYAQLNSSRIASLQSLSSLDHGWMAVVESEPRIVTTLQHLDGSDSLLTKGGDIELQRSGLSLAIANAHHDGRVVLSTQGIHTVEKVLGEEAAYRIRVPRNQQGAASLDLLMGEASARTLVRSGGLLATGADAVLTARRSAELLEQGNATAAQSELNHAIARNVGGWAGGASTAMALGGSGFVPAAVVAADALLLSKAFDKGADLLDNRAIYHQTDNAGVGWQFNGRNWEREGSIDRTQDGRDNPIEHRIAASYEKSQELGALASAKAAELALGKAPMPQDPFRIPAQPSDQRGLDNADWRRNPETQAWERQVKTGVSGANDRGAYETQTATPERAQQLNQQALARIESNIATGQEAMAADYLAGHAAQRAHHHGVAIPAAVDSAKATPDAVMGSDGQRYQRNDAGQWLSSAGQASGNLAAELELTNQMRQPSLERWQDELTAIQSRPAPSPAQAEQNELVYRYRISGVDLLINPQTQQAIELAVQRTKEASGISGPLQQQLQPNESGQYGYDSPIVHYQTGQDGVARQVAVTGSDELRQALDQVRAQQLDPAPIPDSPELQITALSRDEREAFQQALREANRQGASTQEAQQVASFAAASVHDPRQDEALAPEAAVDLEHQREPALQPTPVPATQAHAMQAAAAAATVPSAVPVEPESVQQPRVQVQVQREQPRTGADDRRVVSATDETAQREADRTRQPEMPPPAKVTERHMVGSQPSMTRPEPSWQLQEGTAQRRPTAAPEPSSLAPKFADVEQPAVPLHRSPADAAATEAESHTSPSTTPGPSLHMPTEREIDPTLQPLEVPTTPAPANANAYEMPAARSTTFPLQPDHPDHTLYQQVRGGVAALDASHGRDFDETSDRMSASLLVLAKDSGLERVDHVLLSRAPLGGHAGDNLFVVQGEPGNPAHLRAVVATEQAALTPVADSLQQLEAVNERQMQMALDRRQEQVQLEQVQQQDTHARSLGMR